MTRARYTGATLPSAETAEQRQASVRAVCYARVVGDPSGPTEGEERTDDKPEADRVASLYDLIEDDPYLQEPFWPPILFGLGLIVVISVVVLWRHGVIG